MQPGSTVWNGDKCGVVIANDGAQVTVAYYAEVDTTDIGGENANPFSSSRAVAAADDAAATEQVEPVERRGTPLSRALHRARINAEPEASTEPTEPTEPTEGDLVEVDGVPYRRGADGTLVPVPQAPTIAPIVQSPPAVGAGQ